MTVMHLAYELGKMESEILELTPEEFSRWVAFFQIMDENKGKNKPKRARGAPSPGANRRKG